MACQTTIASLPKDLNSEIFIRLDPKSVLICKYVCKSWYNLISNTSFHQLYSKERPSITGFFYQSSDMYPEKLQFVSMCPRQEVITDPPSCLGFLDSPAILQNSCNGLLLWLVENSQFVISNPLNDKFIRLNWCFDSVRIFACGVAFDPLVSDQFKVIFLIAESTGCLKSRVFSSNGMDWGVEIETQVPFNQAPPYGSSRGVFLNGVLYWELSNHSLLAYNVSDDVAGVIRLPKMKKLTENLSLVEPGCLGESMGDLYYCRLLGMVLCVWERKKMPLASSATWKLKHKIKFSSVMKMYPEFKFLGSQALTFLDDCRGILLSVKDGMIEFRFADKAVQKLYKARRTVSRRIGNGINANYSTCVQPSMLFPFVQSLALLNIRTQS